MSEYLQPLDDLTPQQSEALADLCERFGVEYRHYHYSPAFELPDGYVAGWLGGAEKAGRTIYVGCSPEGQIHS